MGEQVLSDECLENRFNRQVGRADTDIGEF
jgi:hypothetical protein